MTREDKVKDNWELIRASEDEFNPEDENAIDRVIQGHCPGDSIFEEIFSEAELGECLCSNPNLEQGLTASERCRKHWKGEI
jgi:hypothetical protein